MIAVDTALASTLGGDSTLAADATGGVHREKVVDGSVPPYMVFAKLPTGREDVYSLAGRAFRELRYLVKAVDEGPDQTRANRMKDRADALLTDQAIAITGYTLMSLRRLGDVEYREDGLGGKTYQHIGGIYGIQVDPT